MEFYDGVPVVNYTPTDVDNFFFDFTDFLLDNRGTEKDYLWKMLDQFYHQFNDQLLGNNRCSDYSTFNRLLGIFGTRRCNNSIIGPFNSDYSSFHGIFIVLLVKHNFL
jgi:hypothetical protein